MLAHGDNVTLQTLPFQRQKLSLALESGLVVELALANGKVANMTQAVA